MAEIAGTAIATGIKAASPVVTLAITQTIAHIKAVSNAITDRVSRDLRLGYSDFLIASYNRCQQVKTIVTGDQPVSLLDVYVHLNLRCGEDEIQDDDLICNLESYKRVVISGTGGAGKSMLMKYLTVARFENTKGRIPLFVELRNLNNISSKDLLHYCFASCSTSQIQVTFANFEKVFAAGGFILILDGFDEIDSEHKDNIERQIIELGQKFPDSIIVISSRNDPRFKSWQNYYIFNVRHLSQAQVKELIIKVKYDSGIKKRFLKELTALWKTHESFLSIPLLSVIMLLTFGKFSEISPKATLFYKLAFQTLFREHDANKEQFKRPMNTSLELDDFERVFSAFCAIGYLDNKYSFSNALATNFTKSAMKYARLDFKESDYIKDLVQNVCMLQEEGNELTFVHRSFQEYFCALFLVGYHEKNRFDVINEVALRDNDSTLAMMKELDESKLEIVWLIPTLEGFINDLSSRIESKSSSYALNWLYKSGIYDKSYRLNALTISDRNTVSILRHLGQLYPDFQMRLNPSKIFSDLRPADFKEFLVERGLSDRPTIADFLKSVENSNGKLISPEIEFTKAEDDWLEELGIMATMKSVLGGLKQLHKAVLKQRSSQEAIIIV